MINKDFFSVPKNEIPYLTSDLTVVGGKIVYGSGEFSDFDTPIPPAMPNWSPVNQYGGYAAWGDTEDAGKNSLSPQNTAAMAASCGCSSACALHGHNHAKAWKSNAPVSNIKDFFGAFGCSCWAV